MQIAFRCLPRRAGFVLRGLVALRGLVGLAAVSGAMVAAAPAAAQSDESRAAARAAATEGLRALQEGRYKEALDYCTRAESLMHAPTHLLLIARVQTKLGHLVEAQEAYIKIQREHLVASAPKAFLDAQAAASEEQAALAPRVPSLKVVLVLHGAAAGGDAQVTLDGSPYPSALIGMASPINPGSHTLEAKSSSAAAEPVTVSVAEGARETATLELKATATPGPVAARPPVPADLPPAQAPSSRQGLRIGGWVGIGVGVAGLAAGTFFVAKNHSDRNDANALCGSSGCPESRRPEIVSYDNSANSAAALSWISYGVGAAGLVTGAVLLWVGHGKPSAPHTGQVTPWFGGTRVVGVRVRF